MSRNVTVGDPVLIDEKRLDRECLDQPRRVREAGEAAAQARHDHGRAKARLDLVEAQLRLCIVSTPSDWTGPPIPEKCTVDTVNALITSHDDFQAAVKELGEAKFALDVEEALLNGLQHRKSMLSDAIQLHLSNYHSDPPLPQAASKEVRTARREAGDGQVMPSKNGVRKKKKKAKA